MRFLIAIFLVVSVYAKVIDKIVILVNNQPITSFDISQTEKNLGINKNDAISYLIDKAILNSAIKKRGIYVDDFDIDKAMQKIANQNGMSLYNFKNYLLQKNQLASLKKQIKNNLQKEKLIQSLDIRVTQDDVKKYYNSHKNEFMLPSKIDVTQYSSQNKDLLNNVIQNPLLNTNNQVSIKDMSFDINNTNPKLMSFLAKTDINNFSPIINLQNKFVSFYIIKKYQPAPLPFNMVAEGIYQKLLNTQKQQALKDFISKLRAKADIQFLN